MSIDADEILKALDDGARNFVFPMLDNGYVYPAAARMSLHRGANDWGMVFETFGFSPRAGLPDLVVTTFASTPTRHKSASDYISEVAYLAYLGAHPNSEQVWAFPVENESWIETENEETVADGAITLMLRGTEVALPSIRDYAEAGIRLETPGRIYVYEMARALAHVHRDSVLATAVERRSALPAEVDQIMVLEDWHHPDVVADVLPCDTETFQQLASVLATGDRAAYRTREPVNTHWSYWPEGGTL